MKKKIGSQIRSGFTLVEILIVITIMGILAAIVIPTFGSATVATAQSSFATSIRVFIQGAILYEAKNGVYPPDGSSGVCPAGLEAYIDEQKFQRDTPIGGVWDTGVDSLGVHFLAGHGSNPGDAYMTEIDAIMDDGNLATGAFRKIAADRYYVSLVP